MVHTGEYSSMLLLISMWRGGVCISVHCFVLYHTLWYCFESFPLLPFWRSYKFTYNTVHVFITFINAFAKCPLLLSSERKVHHCESSDPLVAFQLAFHQLPQTETTQHAPLKLWAPTSNLLCLATSVEVDLTSTLIWEISRVYLVNVGG